MTLLKLLSSNVTGPIRMRNNIHPSQCDLPAGASRLRQPGRTSPGTVRK